ncbi:activator of Hsp90 ATPase [Suillus plorans]|uniref:Activator of Hsp90 ATPase n=1 Tax=Suillus plorans TaxID=116603 RepID=A0A9P7ALW6_9AGAM|nr:activator of Hsp90 ATPase [Suillus plorans]KAG1792208.1 activator of Hsp90 ATPase [Suillus plorans]
MVMPSSTANWHWKNKNVTSWAKEWFERELTAIVIEGTEGNVTISSVRIEDGDVELGQRKSKLITIYDIQMKVDWRGATSDGTDVAGKLSIPEVSHEITLDKLSDYVYDWTLDTASSPEVNALFAFVKTRLPPALEAKFAEFPVALIDTHGKDLTVSGQSSLPGTPPPSTEATAATASSASTTVPKPAPVKQSQTNINTSSVVKEATFMAASDDLFGLFTDERRIPSWTRAPAQSAAQADTEYSLFGGGVKGKYVSLTPGKEIVQTWALQSPTWPSEHFATLTTTFEQSSDSTKVTFTLDGVPKGMEDELTRNLEGYYIHGLKSIGLGTVL